MSDITKDWSFGGMLDEIRIRNKLTLREYGKKVGHDVGNLSRLLRNRSSPPKTCVGVMLLLAPLEHTEFEENWLCCAAFNHHLGKLKECFKWMK